MYRIAKGVLRSQGAKGRPSEMEVNILQWEGDIVCSRMWDGTTVGEHCFLK